MAVRALPAVRSARSFGRWDPFREFDGWIDGVLREVSRDVSRDTASWTPAADVSESEDAFLVQVELPGVRREDITVDLDVDVLSVTGEFNVTEPQGQVRHRTRRSGRFAYRVRLPHELDGDRVTAELTDGVLSVRVPKSEAAKPRRIEIESK